MGLIICGTGIVQWRADVRVVRRALDQEELAALVSAAEAGEPFRDLAGADEVMLYLMAAFSGRRSFLTLRATLPAVLRSEFGYENRPDNRAEVVTK